MISPLPMLTHVSCSIDLPIVDGGPEDTPVYLGDSRNDIDASFLCQTGW